MKQNPRPLAALAAVAALALAGMPLAQAQVDHVLPWSRFAEDAIENLVVADGPCNLSKRDFLAGREPLEPWLTRPHCGVWS